MSETEGQESFFKCERYFIDARLQLAVALPLLAILAVVAVAYIAAIYVLPGVGALDGMTAAETRSLFMRANIVYYSIAAAALACVAVFLMHRVAGPALVIERAVRALQRGEFEQRLQLRPSDYLKSLAAAVAELRSQLAEQEDGRQDLVRELAARLAANDLEAARGLAAQLGSPNGSGPATPLATDS